MKHPEPGSLGARLRSHRTNAGMTLEELSQASGVSVRAIGDIERGRSRGAQERSVEALAEALGLTEGGRSQLLTAAREGRRRPVAVLSGWGDLPPVLPDFVGRGTEADWLRDRCAGPGERTPVAIVSGGPGLGKTSLVIHTAHSVADRFADGVCFLDLRGLDPVPLAPDEALLRLLDALSVRERDIPTDPQQRLTLYRRVVKDRAALIVLDNAAYEAQVRPLLPGVGSSAVWITSRRMLSGIEHADRLNLRPLPGPDATSLLSNILATRNSDGGDDNSVDALADIAGLCGNSPLALRIAGNRLLSRPAWSPRALAERLAFEDLRLDRLTAGDLHIQAAFTLSYDQLTDPAKLLFRRLALVPGADFGPALGAALTEQPWAAVEQTMDELIELSLLVPTTADRASFHDLLRLFADRRLHDEDTPDSRSRARTRMNDWLLATAREAGQWFEPSHVPAPADPAAAVRLGSKDAADAWIRTENVNWLAALRQAVADGAYESVLATADSMHWFSDRWTYWGHWHTVFALACEAALALGDAAAEATHLNYLSWAQSVCLGQPAEALATALRAAELARQCDDQRQQAWAYNYAGYAAAVLDRSQESLDHLQKSIALFPGSGDKEGLPQALIALAHAYSLLGHFDDGMHALERIFPLLDDPATAPAAHIADWTRFVTQGWIARMHAGAGRWDEAISAYRTAVELDVAVDFPQRQGGMLSALAEVLHDQGRTTEAREALDRARRVFLANDFTTEADQTQKLLDTWPAEDARLADAE